MRRIRRRIRGGDLGFHSFRYFDSTRISSFTTCVWCTEYTPCPPAPPPPAAPPPVASSPSCSPPPPPLPLPPASRLFMTNNKGRSRDFRSLKTAQSSMTDSCSPEPASQPASSPVLGAEGGQDSLEGGHHGHLDAIKWWIASGREMDLGTAREWKKDAIGGAKEEGRTEVVTLLKRFQSDAARPNMILESSLVCLTTWLTRCSPWWSLSLMEYCESKSPRPPLLQPGSSPLPGAFL